MTTHAATIRFYDKHAVVLCPRGHLIETIRLNKGFGGSGDAAELGSYQAGRGNRFDRLAEQCCPNEEVIA